MELNNKYTEEEIKAINLSREAAGIEPLTLKSEAVNTTGENDAIIGEVQNETPEEIKKRQNENEERRLKQQGGLRPNMTFHYTLINWDGVAETVLIKYPTTNKAVRYSKMEFDPTTGKAVLVFADIVTDFTNDDLLPRFDMNNFPVAEISEFSTFLSRVVSNPFFK